MKKILSLIVPVLFIFLTTSFTMPKNLTHSVIVRYSGNIENISTNLGSISHKPLKIEKIFNNLDYSVPSAKKLDEYYLITFDHYNQVEKAIDILKYDRNISSIQPDFLGEINYVPNDPDYSMQHHLRQIHAEEAWDISQGDRAIKIGIIDTGVEHDHPDLLDHIWTNPNEIPDNGIDDDNNGFRDDIHGWDFVHVTQAQRNEYENQGYQLLEYEDYVDADNDPMDRNGHGTHCAGLAAGVTDNGIGIAGVAFHAQIVPLRIGYAIIKPDESHGAVGYESNMAKAFTYAANNGVDVINLSFSNTGTLLEDASEYCYEKGTAVFVSAGNDDTDESSSLLDESPYVFTVAAIDSTNHKSWYSNYGSWVDISAPGGNHAPGLYSTWIEHSYGYASGTSMASPVAAGGFAFMKANFPDYTLDELYARYKFTTENIDSLNPYYENQLGLGRIDLLNAINQQARPEVNLTGYQLNDTDQNGLIQSGESAQLNLQFQNVWEEFDSLRISIVSDDPYVEILDSEFVLQIDKFSSFETNSQINFTPPLYYHTITFDITIQAGEDYIKNFTIDHQIGIPQLLIVFEDTLNPDLKEVEEFCQFQQVSYKKISSNAVLNDQIPYFKNIIVIKSLDQPYYQNFTRNLIDLAISEEINLFLSGNQNYEEIQKNDSLLNWYETILSCELEKNIFNSDLLVGNPNNPISYDLNLSLNGGTPLVLDHNTDYSQYLFKTIIDEDSLLIGSYKMNQSSFVTFLGFELSNINKSHLRNAILSRFLQLQSDQFIVIHNPAKDSETIDDSIEIVVYAYGNTENLEANLRWKTAEEQSYQSLQMIQEDGFFSAFIPPQTGDSVLINYYIQIQNDSSIQILPYNFPQTYSFTLGIDQNPPEVIDFITPLSTSFPFQEYQIPIFVEDDQGIDPDLSILKYRRIGIDDTYLEQPLLHIDTTQYLGVISSDTLIPLNTKIVYWFEIYDQSSQANMLRYPDRGALSITISDSVIIDDFNNTNTLDNWNLQNYWGFSDISAYEGAYHLKYPYDNIFYPNNRNDCAVFQHPVNLSECEQIYLKFAHKLIVPNSNINDSAIIEISTDHQESWIPLKSYSEKQLQYQEETIDLISYCQNEFDSIYFRFRFYSDGTENKHGWFIDNIRLTANNIVEVLENNKKLPQKTVLYPNTPNPFNPSTEIEFDLYEISDVNLSIYNIMGRKVCTLIETKMQPGHYSTIWNGKDNYFQECTTGIYFLQLKVGKKRLTQKMLLLK